MPVGTCSFYRRSTLTSTLLNIIMPLYMTISDPYSISIKKKKKKLLTKKENDEKKKKKQ